MMECKNPECSHYPYYGVAPHECYWRKPGGFDKNPLGTSTIIDVDAWPDNFLAEIDPETPIGPQLSWGLCGVYYCPDCKHGMHETALLRGGATIQHDLVKPVDNSVDKPVFRGRAG